MCVKLKMCKCRKSVNLIRQGINHISYMPVTVTVSKTL